MTTLTPSEQTALDKIRAGTHVLVPTDNPEMKYYSDRYYELLDAVGKFPELPAPRVLIGLDSQSSFPDDSNRGKAMQGEIGLVRIPPKSEAEGGAGFWDRITNGKWRHFRSLSG